MFDWSLWIWTLTGVPRNRPLRYAMPNYKFKPSEHIAEMIAEDWLEADNKIIFEHMWQRMTIK